MKIKEFKNGAYVTSERNPVNGFTTVKLVGVSGQTLDKVSCNTSDYARDYFKSFCKVAKNLK